MDCVETATFKDQSPEEVQRLLHMVVVGGGPTGVEFAGELQDFFEDDLKKWIPEIKDNFHVTLVEALPNVSDNPVFDVPWLLLGRPVSCRASADFMLRCFQCSPSN